MGLPARITFVTFGVADLAASTRFYEALGWHRSSASVDGEVSFFKAGQVFLSLWPYELMVDDMGIEAPPKPSFPGVAVSVNVDSEDEVVAALAAAETAGARIVRPGERADWGGFSGWFADPEGHLWEVAWNSGFPFPD